jgi:hypothetical protein
MRGGQGQQLQEEAKRAEEVEEGAAGGERGAAAAAARAGRRAVSGLCNMHFKAVPPAGGWSASAGVVASDGGRGGMAGSRAAAGAGAQRKALEAYAMGSTW